MKKKHSKQSPDRTSGGSRHQSDSSDFYSGAPTEQPLSARGSSASAQNIRKTGRHQAVAGRRKETVDPREKMALLAILKTGILLILLIIAFFMLRYGIKLYEESIWMENQVAGEASPVMREVVMVEEFDIQDQAAREQFAEGIQVWKDAERLVRSADGFMQRGNYDQAITRCQDALRIDPAHRKALELLGQLYLAKAAYVEAANAFIRLLSVDPTQERIQKSLILALDAYGDPEAVMHMAEWYQDSNAYDADVQLYLANALYAQESFAEAATAYGRVLRDSPLDVHALERQASAFMQTGQFERARPVWEKLRQNNFREQSYYRQLAICNAQLKQGQETVQVLGRAAQVLGQKQVMGWMQDPQFDPVRDDSSFQSFASRIGGEEFRLWLEKAAHSMEVGQQPKEIVPQLGLPAKDSLDSELLRPKH